MVATAIEAMIRDAGRTPRQRTTFYGVPPPGQQAIAMADEGAPEAMIAAE
jgi:hypothetical protein